MATKADKSQQAAKSAERTCKQCNGTGKLPGTDGQKSCYACRGTGKRSGDYSTK